MVCLCGFELYSRWVPLIIGHRQISLKESYSVDSSHVWARKRPALVAA